MPNIHPAKFVLILLAAILVIDGRLARAAEPARQVGVVSHVKVLSDKVRRRVEPRGLEEVVH